MVNTHIEVDLNERFAPNTSINAAIHEILANTPEPSRSRMRKKIRHARDAALEHGTDNTDAEARHVFREFLVGYKLNSNGFELEYERNLDGKTPDWCDDRSKLLLEVLTCERGGTSDPAKRVAESIAEKVARYGSIVTDRKLSFAVAVHGDFGCVFEVDDCEKAIRDGRVYDVHPELSGVIYFAESHLVLVTQPDGSKRRKQLYGYVYFPNQNARRRIDLSTALSSET